MHILSNHEAKARTPKRSMECQNMAEIHKLLSGQEAAEILGISEQTLRIQRIKGGGVKFVKVGRLVRYRQSDIDAYLDARTFENTSQMGV